MQHPNTMLSLTMIVCSQQSSLTTNSWDQSGTLKSLRWILIYIQMLMKQQRHHPFSTGTEQPYFNQDTCSFFPSEDKKIRVTFRDNLSRKVEIKQDISQTVCKGSTSSGPEGAPSKNVNKSESPVWPILKRSTRQWKEVDWLTFMTKEPTNNANYRLQPSIPNWVTFNPKEHLQMVPRGCLKKYLAH